MNRIQLSRLRLLCAALAIASGTASANIIGPTGTTEGGEMALAVFSQSANATYLFDTGILVRDFHALASAPGQPYQYAVNLSADSQFQAFMAQAAVSQDIAFSFFGGDNIGNPASSRVLLASFSGDVGSVLNSQMVSAMNIMGGYLSQANMDPRLNPSLGGGANASATLAGNLFDDSFLGYLPATRGALQNTIQVYHLTRSSTSMGGDALETVVGTATVGRADNGQYWFVFGTTPETGALPTVPEAEAWAMMLAGLACAAPFLRRRKA